MAGEFQSHVDEMVKDTSIAEVRQQINEIRNFDIRGEIEKAVDADGSLRSTFNEDPLGGSAASYVPPSGSHSIEAPPDADAPVDPARALELPRVRGAVVRAARHCPASPGRRSAAAAPAGSAGVHPPGTSLPGAPRA